MDLSTTTVSTPLLFQEAVLLSNGFQSSYFAHNIKLTDLYNVGTNGYKRIPAKTKVISNVIQLAPPAMAGLIVWWSHSAIVCGSET